MKELEQFLLRAESVLARVEAMLPARAPEVDWSATAFRWRVGRDQRGDAVVPREVVFAPKTASAYVRSDNARDVLQVILQGIPPATTDGNDYRPQLAELGAGGGPTDIAVYADATGRRYILALRPARLRIGPRG